MNFDCSIHEGVGTIFAEVSWTAHTGIPGLLMVQDDIAFVNIFRSQGMSDSSLHNRDSTFSSSYYAIQSKL